MKYLIGAKFPCSVYVLAQYMEVVSSLAVLTSLPSCPFLPFLAVLTSPSFPRCPIFSFVAVLTWPSFPCCLYLFFLAAGPKPGEGVNRVMNTPMIFQNSPKSAFPVPFKMQNSKNTVCFLVMFIKHSP